MEGMSDSVQPAGHSTVTCIPVYTASHGEHNQRHIRRQKKSVGLTNIIFGVSEILWRTETLCFLYGTTRSISVKQKRFGDAISILSLSRAFPCLYQGPLADLAYPGRLTVSVH